MKNLVFNLRTAKAQAEGCAKVTKSSRMAKILTTLTLLLTLGVGQMWAWTIYLYTGGFTSWEKDGNETFQVWDGSTNHNLTSLGNHWYSGDMGSFSSGSVWVKRCAPNYGSEYNSFNVSVSSTNCVTYVSGWSSGGILTYYIKHPWDGSNWTWQTMSFNSANTFKYTGVYHSGNGANVNQDKANSNYLSPSNTSNVNDAVPAIWTYTPSSNSLRIDPAYTLTVNADSHGSASGSQPKGIKMSTKYAISASNNTGYHFSSWSRVSGGTCTFDNSSSASTNVTVTGNASATVKASFAANTYTVAYNANDDQYPGTASGSTTSSSHTYGTAKNLTSNGFSRTGYIFAGWATTPTGDVAYTNGQSVTNLSSTQGATVTLYAKWTAITVSATVSPTSGTVGSNSLTFSITSNVPTNSNYYVGVYNFGESEYAAGELNGVTAYNSNPQSYTGSPNFASEGTYYTRVFVMKESVVQATSDKVSFLVASATFSVTVNAGAGGTVSPTSISASESSWSSNITATPNAGYRFVNWTSSGGGITINGNTSNPTQIKATSTGGTLTANFAAATYRVTLDNQSATTAGTKYVDATYNTTTLTSITKPTKANYTFGGYYTEPSGGGTQIINANGNWLASKSGFTDGSKKSQVTEAKTLYAKWTETTYAVTVAVDDASHASGNIACTAAGWVAGKSGTAQIGNLTNVTITVGAAAAGYKFDGGYWTLTGGVTLIDGSLTSPSIIVKATATGSATYTYAEDLTTPYVIKGGTAITGGTAWSTEIAFTKKSGESAGSVAYAEIPISAAVGDVANTNYNFKVVNGSTWYGLSGDGDWWYSSSSGEQTMVVDNQNIQLRANVVGTYTVKLDYTTPASPKITITWPVALSIYRSNPTDGTNIGDHAWNSMPSSTSYRWLLDLAANTTYEFKINDKGAYYGSNTDITTSVSNRAFSTGTSDTKLITKSAGRFIFTWDGSGHRLTVVYPKSAAISASPASVYTGGTTTLTGYASELGSGSHTITYEFYKGTELTPANLIASKSKTESATYQQETQDVTVNFDGNTTSQIYTIQIKEGGSILATNTVTVYRKWDIYVHDVASWNAMKLYMYSEDGLTHNEEWPGPDCGNYNGSTTWYTVPLDAKYDRFILNNNAGKKQTFAGEGALRTDITTYIPGTYWYTDFNSTAGGISYYRLTNITLSTPTVTIAATVTNATQLNLTGTVTNCGGDGSFASDMKEVYFQVAGTKNAATTVSTTSGTFTKVLSNATAGTTNTLQAFATNIHSTGSSSVLHYTNVTLDRQGGTTGTTAVTAVENMAMPAGATAPGKTGYTFGGYYANTGGSGKQYYNASMGSVNNWDQTTKDKTIYAKWTAITYKVHFNGNGNTSGSMSDQTGIVYDSGTTLTANAFEKTGYNFAGWATTQERATAGTIDRLDGAAHGNLASTQGATAQLWAVWTPKTCTVTFDYQSSAEGYAGAGTLSNVTATYDAAMPALTGNMPTAAQGYAFMGFYSETGGNGTLYYNPDKTSAHNWDVDTESTTLYAYYKKAEITDITLNASIFEPVEADADPKAYVTADPVIAPTPTPYTKLCWELRYSNDNPVAGHDPISVSGNQVKFLLNGLAAGGYKIHVELRTGSSCGAGELLSSFDKSFSIASDHIVTVQYKCGDFTLKSPTSVGGKPLDWSEVIEAASITGYTFNHWEAGEGVTIKDDEGEDKTTSTDATIQIKAIYDSKLTAVYNKKNMIYFYNTVGWSDVWVYFYTSDKYWANDWGTGAWRGQYFDGSRPYYDMHRGQMTQIEGTNIWYFDYTAEGWDGWQNVAFTNMGDKSGQGVNPNDAAPDNDHAYFSNTISNPIQVIRRGDHKTSLPMFVPLTNQTKQKKNNNKAEYYSEGYWMNYPENTGYTLRIYNTWNADNATGASREYMIPFSTDKKMPLKQDVEINFSGETWFLIYRNDGNYLQGSHTFKQNDHGDKAMTSTSNAGTASKMKVISDAEGIYTFTLSFHGNGANPEVYSYYVNVEFPAAVGDYRIVYQDNATWSQSTAHDASWNHPSRVIPKIKGDATEAKKDTVSFFISVGSSPTMKFQKIESINATTGAVTWTDVASGSITIPSSITESGVYNFIVTQPVGGASISLEKAEPYTGNFYIRTDGAGSTKWDNYQASDHQMTYTEFSMSAANSFGDKYSHYFMHWSPGGTNIKFCVANDYSPSISDTLEYDLHDWGNLNAGGWLKHQDGKSETEDIYSANVRFMYNQETNKISRAYVSSSTNKSRLFLVLRGNEVIKNESESPISEQGVTNGAILDDKENWIYERILYIKPNSRFKLFACYAKASPTQAGAQYFRGAYDSDNFTSDANSVILISGTSDSYQKARVLYDFKTNRLVCAWLPSDEPIDETLDIDADVMIIRDHQEAAECITFSGSGSLTDVKTVYGAMKFNRWTLNNRYRGKGGVEDNNKDHCDSPADIAEYHGILPAGEQKSVYERSLYFISFPFDVKVSEIFGFGTYGKHWVLEYYDGLNRAKNGYWIDSPANWKYVTPSMAKTYELKAYEGYILCLSLGRMAYDNTEFWANNISNVELYFPSKTPMTNIQTTDVNISGLNEIAGDPYRCTINREGEDGDRRIKDSYWRCLGVPSYDMYAGTLTSDGSTVINWQTDYSTFPFLYAWNMNDNTLTPQSTNRFSFKPMHAYLTQIGTAIYWTNVSATPASVMARQTEEPTEYNWCLTLNAGEQMIDQTYVRMSTDEVITNEFDFGQDLSKELNTGRSDIYSFIGNERAAANSLQMNTETTTIVPLGLNIEATGDYTFSIPDGTNGIGITLIDEETGIRTSLSALDYTVELAAGDYTERFWLEISPVKGAETGIDPGVDARENGVRKVMIDGILYIIRDGKMYDARGARVE